MSDHEPLAPPAAFLAAVQRGEYASPRPARLKRDERHACPEGRLICPLCGSCQGYMTGSDADRIQERGRWRCDECRQEFAADVDCVTTYYTPKPRVVTATAPEGATGGSRLTEEERAL